MTRPRPASKTIYTFGQRRTNSELVRDLHQLGYLRDDDLILDPTYGTGRWWKIWRPANLITSDLYTDNPDGNHWDFTNLPLPDRCVDATVFDPPYKLNGTPGRRGPASSDDSYGVGQPLSWKQRLELMVRGARECARVTRRHLIVKCQDQVVSERKRWQTMMMTSTVEKLGWRLQDMLHVRGFRPQSSSRWQLHSHTDYSTALVFIRRKL